MAQAINSFRSLKAWQRSIQFVKLIYEISRSFPKDEMFCLTNQIRRAALSVPSNISEGYGRQSNNEFIHYLSIANGSRCEVETQAQVAFELGYINNATNQTVIRLSEEIGRLIAGLQRYLQQNKKC